MVSVMSKIPVKCDSKGRVSNSDYGEKVSSEHWIVHLSVVQEGITDSQVYIQVSLYIIYLNI